MVRTMAILSVTPTLRRLGLVTAHPELVNQLANVAEMTRASSSTMRPGSSSSASRPITVLKQEVAQARCDHFDSKKGKTAIKRSGNKAGSFAKCEKCQAQWKWEDGKWETCVSRDSRGSSSRLPLPSSVGTPAADLGWTALPSRTAASTPSLLSAPPLATVPLPGPIPLCQCGHSAVQRAVKKEGPTRGQLFWACPRGTCRFFEWDQQGLARVRASLPPGLSTSSAPSPAPSTAHQPRLRPPKEDMDEMDFDLMTEASDQEEYEQEAWDAEEEFPPETPPTP